MEQIHEVYNTNINEIGRLIRFQTALKDRPDFRRSLEVLNKSGIVLLVACWEAFVEDLASFAFDYFLSEATDYNTFPSKVLTQASKPFWDSKDERGVWALADVGWRRVLTGHKNKIIQEYLGNFNTPRPAQIDALFQSLIGLKSLSSHWHWKGMSASQAKKKLDELVSLRGAIAHRVSASRSVTKRDFFNSGVFITRLGVTSSNAIRSYVHTRVGKYPWSQIEIKF